MTTIIATILANVNANGVNGSSIDFKSDARSYAISLARYGGEIKVCITCVTYGTCVDDAGIWRFTYYAVGSDKLVNAIKRIMRGHKLVSILEEEVAEEVVIETEVEEVEDTRSLTDFDHIHDFHMIANGVAAFTVQGLEGSKEDRTSEFVAYKKLMCSAVGLYGEYRTEGTDMIIKYPLSGGRFEEDVYECVIKEGLTFFRKKTEDSPEAIEEVVAPVTPKPVECIGEIAFNSEGNITYVQTPKNSEYISIKIEDHTSVDFKAEIIAAYNRSLKTCSNRSELEQSLSKELTRYGVGSGGSHIWIVRNATRQAIITGAAFS